VDKNLGIGDDIPDARGIPTGWPLTRSDSHVRCADQDTRLWQYRFQWRIATKRRHPL